MKKIQKTFFALGTMNSIIVNIDDFQETTILKTLDQIRIKIQKLDDLLSVFKKDSEISQINLAAGKNLVEVSEDTFKLVSQGVYYSKLTKGAFDISIYPLSKLYSIGNKKDFIPTAKEIAAAQALVNYKDVVIKENPWRIGLKKAKQGLDLGGIAKGYAADLTKKILLAQQVKSAIINYGGTVITIGEKVVGIQNPLAKNGIALGMLKINNQAVVTSGSYEKYFIKDNKKYHHLIDPQTGTPCNKELLSITVLENKAVKLDALATAAFILGLENGLKLLQQEQIEAIFILNSYQIYTTPGLKKHFKLLNIKKENEYAEKK